MQAIRPGLHTRELHYQSLGFLEKENQKQAGAVGLILSKEGWATGQ